MPLDDTRDPIESMDRQELMAEVRRLRSNNHALNDRVMSERASWQSRAEKAEAQLDYERDRWKFEFDRTCAAHNELRDIYVALHHAKGAPVPAFHSVMDSRFSEALLGKQVWANVYLSKLGGIESERVVEAVTRFLRGEWEPIKSSYLNPVQHCPLVAEAPPAATAPGCICPPGANRDCQSPVCPRKARQSEAAKFIPIPGARL